MLRWPPMPKYRSCFECLAIVCLCTTAALTSRCVVLHCFTFVPLYCCTVQASGTGASSAVGEAVLAAQGSWLPPLSLAAADKDLKEKLVELIMSAKVNFLNAQMTGFGLHVNLMTGQWTEHS